MAATSSSSQVIYPVPTTSDAHSLPFEGCFPFQKRRAARLGIDIYYRPHVQLSSRASRLGIDLFNKDQWNRLEAIQPVRTYPFLDNVHMSAIRQSGRIYKAKWEKQAQFNTENASLLVELIQAIVFSIENIQKQNSYIDQRLDELSQLQERCKSKLLSLDTANHVLTLACENLEFMSASLMDELNRTRTRLAEKMREPRTSGIPMDEIAAMSDARRRESLDQLEYAAVEEIERLSAEERRLTISCESIERERHTADHRLRACRQFTHRTEEMFRSYVIEYKELQIEALSHNQQLVDLYKKYDGWNLMQQVAQRLHRTIETELQFHRDI